MAGEFKNCPMMNCPSANLILKFPSHAEKKKLGIHSLIKLGNALIKINTCM